MATDSKAPSPALIFETFNAHQRTAALKAGIELDVFTAIAEGKNGASEISKRCETSERGMRILCDYLTMIGFLQKNGTQYRLTQDSAVFLDRNSPAYMGGAMDFLLAPTLTGAFSDIAGIVRKGGTLLPGEGSVAPENPIWVQFARAMEGMMTMPAQLMANLLPIDGERKLKVLDIAAGHGIFGIMFAKRYPRAEIVALDWPGVLEVAKANAQKFGVADRYRTIAGSAFDVDYGTGYDIILLTNFLHHFDIPTCEVLVKKVHRALDTNGRAMTLDFVPNEDRISPPEAASFSLMMLGTTQGGDAYTFREFDSMFKNAGFSRSELHPLPPTFQQVVVSHK